MTRLVQLAGPRGERRVCLAGDGWLTTIDGYDSIYALAAAALASKTPLPALVEAHVSAERIDYDAAYDGSGDWRILPVVDHPDDPARLMLSGTGLTHRRSAEQRQAMHAAGAAPTDSLRMYELGVAGGRPEQGRIGAAPEWFYKGTGTQLRAHGEPLLVPPHADDGGEEPEIAGVYLIDAAGMPRRIGMATANEFSDHVLEQRNYLYLAASKVRTCAIGPELTVTADFRDVRGEVAIERGGEVIWSRPIRSGEAAMCHSLRNMEHHHFKFDAHRRPGDLHVHFFGADAFSFGAGISLEHGDVMRVGFDGFGRALRNPIEIRHGAEAVIAVEPV
jgi:hypothetical protein